MIGTLLITACIIYLLSVIIVDVRTRKNKQVVARPTWSFAEEELLREQFPLLSDDELTHFAAALGRAVPDVQDKAAELGVQTAEVVVRRRWTPPEELMLQAYYPTAESEQALNALAARLDRTVEALHSKARRMGIGKASDLLTEAPEGYEEVLEHAGLVSE